MDAIDTSHMIDGNDSFHVGPVGKATGRRALLGNEISASAITKADKDRRLRTLDDEVRDIDIFQCASVDNLQ